MSTTGERYFIYHHPLHCAIRTAPPMSPKSPNSFTLFPFLPPEIRLKIWENVASQPNTIELSCTPITMPFIPCGRWFSHSKPPVVFTICSESREVALMKYSTLNFSPEQMGIPWRKLYINFEVDTLWLCADLCVVWAKDLLEKNEQLKAKLRILAVNESMWKASNPIFYAPGFTTGHQVEGPERVRSGLKALESLVFHS